MQQIDCLIHCCSFHFHTCQSARRQASRCRLWSGRPWAIRQAASAHVHSSFMPCGCPAALLRAMLACVLHVAEQHAHGPMNLQALLVHTPKLCLAAQQSPRTHGPQHDAGARAGSSASATAYPGAWHSPRQRCTPAAPWQRHCNRALMMRTCSSRRASACMPS